jgi:hypothetical protein
MQVYKHVLETSSFKITLLYGGRKSCSSSCRMDNVVFYFADKSRVAIWGWSYGGFVTASVLARDAEKNNIFKVFSPLILY